MSHILSTSAARCFIIVVCLCIAGYSCTSKIFSGESDETGVTYYQNFHLIDKLNKIDTTIRSTVAIRPNRTSEGDTLYLIRNDVEFISFSDTGKTVIDFSNRRIFNYIPSKYENTRKWKKHPALQNGPIALLSGYSACKTQGSVSVAGTTSKCIVQDSLIGAYDIPSSKTASFTNVDNGFISEYILEVSANAETVGIVKVVNRRVNIDKLSFQAALDSVVQLEYVDIHPNDATRLREMYQGFIGLGVENTAFPTTEGTTVNVSSTADRKKLLVVGYAESLTTKFALQNLGRELAKREVELDVIFYSPFDDANTVEDFIKPFDFINFSIDKSASLNDELSIFRFPSFVVIDENQKVIFIRSGYASRLLEEM